MFYPHRNMHLRFEPIDDQTLCARDILSEETWEIDSDLPDFLYQLNGFRDPYKIDLGLSRSEMKYLLKELAQSGLIRYKWIEYYGLDCICLPLFCPRMTHSVYRFFCFLHQILLWVSFPMLFLGIFSLFHSELVSYDISLFSSILLSLLSLIAHELGHAASYVALGGDSFEFGFILLSFLPCAYTGMENDRLKKRVHRIMVNAAGVETNFLLAGMSLIILHWFPNGFLCSFGISNLAIGLFNLCPVPGFDGSRILSESLGNTDIFLTSLKSVIHPQEKRAFRGVYGISRAFCCLFLLSYKCLIPMVLFESIICYFL